MPVKAVICGCGIAGLTLARLLVDRDWDVLAVERSPSGSRGGDYAIDLWGAGVDVVEALGLLPELRRRALPIEEAAFIDSREHRVAALDYRQLRRAAGGRLITVARSDLEGVLRQSLGQRVDLRNGCTVEHFEPDQSGVAVTLSDGTRHAARLLVGADGARSSIRRLAFGARNVTLRYLGLHVAAYTFEEPRLAARVGNRFWVSDTAGRLFAIYGLGGAHLGVLAVHRSCEREVPADPRSVLTRVHSGSGQWVAAALEGCPDSSDLFYDLAHQVVMSVWHTQRVVLLGDSCQAVSLVAGQGASLALAAARALATALREAPDLDGALVRYQQRMEPLVRDGQAAGRRMAAWFVPDSSPHLFMRRVGLGLLHLPWLGDRLMRSEFGESGGSASWTA